MRSKVPVDTAAIPSARRPSAAIEVAPSRWRRALVDPAGIQRSVASVLQRSLGNRAFVGLVQHQAGTMVLQRQAEHWDKATYASADACMQDHFARHPSAKWGDVQAYTDKAMLVWQQNKHNADAHNLTDGRAGWKLRSRQYFGIYTQDGKIVTFGER